MRIPDDKFNLSIPNADQADASQSVDALPAESETATAMPASADSVEQFSPPTSDLPQLDDPNFPVAELTGTATPSAIPVVDSGREEIAHQSEIREGNPLNPYLSLFESSATIDPVLIPGDGSVAPGGTAFPDKWATVDPQVPENSKPESFNVPGLEDLKIAPDHFGIDLSAGGLRGRTSLDHLLGFGGSGETGGLQYKGFNEFNVGKNWSLLSNDIENITGAQSWGDLQNGGDMQTGKDKDGNNVTQTHTWSTDENGNRVDTVNEEITKQDGSRIVNSRTTSDDGSFEQHSTYYNSNGQETKNVSKTEPDGPITVEYYKDGKKTGVLVESTDENGTTTSKLWGPDGEYQGKVETEKDGTQQVYDNHDMPIVAEPEDTNDTSGSTDSGNEYVDPEGGPAGQTNVDPNNFLRIQNVRRDLNITPFNTGDVNTTPSNVDDPQPINIDPKRVYDPRLEKPLVTDGNPEYESQVLFGDGSSIDVSNEAKGGDPVNPNDDSAPLAPPTKLPPR